MAYPQQATISLTYDSSVTGQPDWFKPACQDAANYVAAQIYLPYTFNITVGWGSVNGNTLGSGALAESEYFLDNYTYSQVRGYLIANAKSANALQSVSTLPATSPLPAGAIVWLSTIQELAFGLTPNTFPYNGWVGFKSNASLWWPYSNCPSGVYDFRATAIHEITECLGRFLLYGTGLGGTIDFSIMDLFRYKSNGTRQLGNDTASPSYFSIDGGATNLRGWYTGGANNGDPGDWAGSPGSDAYDAFGTTGVQLFPTSNADLILMDVLGYNAYSGIVSQLGEGRTQHPAANYIEKPLMGKLYSQRFTIPGAHRYSMALPSGYTAKPPAPTRTYTKTFERLGPTGGPCTPVGGRV